VLQIQNAFCNAKQKSVVQSFTQTRACNASQQKKVLLFLILQLFRAYCNTFWALKHDQNLILVRFVGAAQSPAALTEATLKRPQPPFFLLMPVTVAQKRMEGRPWTPSKNCSTKGGGFNPKSWVVANSPYVGICSSASRANTCRWSGHPTPMSEGAGSAV